MFQPLRKDPAIYSFTYKFWHHFLVLSQCQWFLKMPFISLLPSPCFSESVDHTSVTNAPSVSMRVCGCYCLPRAVLGLHVIKQRFPRVPCGEASCLPGSHLYVQLSTTKGELCSVPQQAVRAFLLALAPGCLCLHSESTWIVYLFTQCCLYIRPYFFVHLEYPVSILLPQGLIFLVDTKLNFNTLKRIIQLICC